ncbi:PAS domain S-box protein [Alicyclobacillus curvatus]|nr:PAS domain S-box protein [Alicyclobacillus curvatus]
MFQTATKELQHTVQVLTDTQTALNEACMVAVMDEHGVMTYVNSMFCDLLHLSHDLLIGKNIFEVLRPSGVLMPNDKIDPMATEVVFGTVEIWRGELLPRKSQNALRCFQSTVVPFRNRVGVPYEYVLIGTDITEQKVAEANAKERQEQLKTLLDTLSESIVFTDAEGHWLEANRQALDMLGINSSEWRGQTFSSLTSRFLTPDWIEDINRLNALAWKQNTPLHYEATRQTSNGKLYVEGDISQVFHTDGTPHGLVSVLRDVTGIKLSEEEYMRVKHEFESIIDNMADAISILELSGDITWTNRAFERMFTWEEECQRETFLTIARDQLHEWVEVVKRNEKIVGSEMSIPRKDGQLIYLSVTVSPIYCREGQVCAMSLILRDITERIVNHNLLRRAEQLSMAGQMAAGIAHEIRNPLASLRGFTQLIRSGTDRAAEYCDIMLREFDRINSIIEQLLLLSKPKKLQHKPVNIRRLLDDVLLLLESQSNLRNIRVVREYGAEDTMVECAENDLKQVFINILKNAIEATPPGKQITVGVVSRGDNQIQVRFKDQGPGIPPSSVSRLGEPFHTTKSNGTGLGLMITSRIVEEHGGLLEIVNGSHVGAIVDVILPVQVLNLHT